MASRKSTRWASLRDAEYGDANRDSGSEGAGMFVPDEESDLDEYGGEYLEGEGDDTESQNESSPEVDSMASLETNDRNIDDNPNTGTSNYSFNVPKDADGDASMMNEALAETPQFHNNRSSTA